ncbi:UPF0481 protein At3g47200-like [Coffea arabica]|uniref:UPF0481 protein At3g47200-like n=1 Tax=Coffea arabica TaxID=13443 RepID=A0A6P6VLU4_COFAR|nr:putative UPF0481 protein At3g02645 [Coffea arabica]
MSKDRCKRVTTQIDLKLSGMSNSTTTEQRIFRVHHRLRSQNEEAYEPQMFSIGPYHCGKSSLEEGQTHKLRYLKELLSRTGESSAEKYIEALTNLEDKARGWYAEDDLIGLGADEFVEMMCLDGCFIIDFFRKFGAKYGTVDVNYLPKADDPIFQKRWIMGSLFRDILLFENQLPFFILVQLFDMTKPPGGAIEVNLIDLATFPESPLHSFFPGEKPESFTNPTTVLRDRDAQHVVHLLHLVHECWCWSFAAKLRAPADVEIQGNRVSRVVYSTRGGNLEHIESASELRQTGIKFEKAKQSVSWLDITFERGVMKIPPLYVHDVTECVLRNLIAYEMYTLNGPWDRKYVLDYVTFMDSLIDSSSDVEKLRSRKIMTKWLGDDEAISSMFNKLGKEVEFDQGNRLFCYWKVFQRVNEYSSSRWNTWRAHLLRNYFNNPWSIISFLAALVLLFLTLVATISSILQYTDQPNCICKSS